MELVLAEPVPSKTAWVGREDLIEQVLACWTLVNDADRALCPRIVGRPGMGKTTLAQAAGAALGTPVHIFQCTMDTRPEDLLILPVIADSGRITYHASALVTALLDGGTVILDEANRMSEKSWASLAPLLDARRYVESSIAGVRIDAHPDFRACVTMNEDSSTYEVPEYILSRLQPMIEVDFPTRDEELAILRWNVDFAPDALLTMTADFLSGAHKHHLGYTTRDGINIMRYALKLQHRGVMADTTQVFVFAMEAVLGTGAGDFAARAPVAGSDDPDADDDEADDLFDSEADDTSDDKG